MIIYSSCRKTGAPRQSFGSTESLKINTKKFLKNLKKVLTKQASDGKIYIADHESGKRKKLSEKRARTMKTS